MNYTKTKSTKLLILITLTLLLGCTQTNKQNYQTNKTSGNKNAIFKYVSSSNDLENEVKILQTNKEISYHTFDFNKNLITYKSKTKNGNWKTFEFRIKQSNTKESLQGLKGMEFSIDNPTCFQIWVSTIGNIGYEFNNGQKLVFYDVKEL
ncbi:hypothetical protein [Olleya sp. Hel_I_94]|uniref:hypothetical protein n=1 Tax=Olleya sp. Hel_I_94 TaxID=1250001 RepID=UPI00119D58CF|nr:hypothetical protein [Olleya sp. Hel_I_94]TVZ48647.1 hypothetical protein JM82_3297 [Olleya sp. Hel_I_94]